MPAKEAGATGKTLSTDVFVDKLEFKNTQPGLFNQVCAVFLVLLALIIAINFTYAQTINSPATAAAKPTIVTTVDEVTLDLVVRQKNKPVLDLQPDDLAVTDNGTPVKLSSLHLVNGGAGTEHRIILVFDRLDPAAGKNARDIAAKILKAFPATGFSFSVMNIGGRLRLFQGFTNDRAVLANAVSEATEDDSERGAAVNAASASRTDAAAIPEKNLMAAAQTGMDPAGERISVERRDTARALLAALEESQRIAQDQHCSPSLASLLALARTQRQLTGRKAVIYFAQGMRLDSSARDTLRSVIGAANRSGVSVYTVDANAVDDQGREGMIATAAIGNVISAGNQTHAPTGPNAPHGAYGPGIGSQINDQMTRIENEGLSGSNNPLADLAVSTGGAYVMPSDNLKKPLQLMIDDMTTYYEASYVPPIQECDGRFRPVAIRPLRKGLRVRSRAGYFAVPSGNGSGIRPFEAPLMKILGEAQLPDDLKFKSAVLMLGDLPDGNANTLAIEVPLSELEMHEDPNSNLFSVHLSMVAQIRNQSGAVIEHFSEDVPRHGALETMDKARAEVVTVQRHFAAGPGEYVVEVAVQDRNSGKMSAQRNNFEIADAQAGPSLSDLTLVRRTDPFNVETDPLEPLRYENGRVVPNLSGHLPEEAKAASLFFLIHPDSASSDQATLEIEVLRNGEPVAHNPLPLHKGTGQGAVPYLVSIPASALSVGNYEVTATLTQGGKSSERGLSFRKDGPELASVASGEKSGAGSGAESISDAGVESPGVTRHDVHGLNITALPPETVAPLSPDDLQLLIADVRKRAISYHDSLPNFMCVERTDRSIDPSGNGKWRHKDSIAELLRFHDNSETRQTLELNGKPSSISHDDLRGKGGALSWGEFGGGLSAVFQSSSKADFQWKETGAIGSETVQVLTYRIAQENSSWGLAGNNNWKLYPAFHGLLYIDSATRNVRRITLEADNLPREFNIHAASIAVDYDYIAIGSHDYLMPVRGTVSLRKGKREAVLNEIEFRNYRRYGSKSRVLYGGQVLP
jgi:VWFA-related protein